MSNSFSPTDTITSIKGVGNSISKKINKLGIQSVGDLLNHFPKKYYDFTELVLIKNLSEGKMASFIGTIGKINSFFTKTGKLITQTAVNDSTGKILLTWFNNPYIKRILKENTSYTIAGRVSFWGRGLTVVSPIIEEGSTPSINTGGFVPIYPQTEGVTSKWLRTKIYQLLSDVEIDDPIENKLLKSLNLLSEKYAYQNIHFPISTDLRWKADKRLSFNEHLRINITNRLAQRNLGESIAIKINQKTTNETNQNLPFVLTTDQQKTISAIYKDLQNAGFTHRLIQGDTGSGKTATLVFAANQCLFNNFSCAVMAPTEILAVQHFKTFQSLSLFPKQIQLITGSLKQKIQINQPRIYIGTHSLLTQLPKILKYPLAFVAIDEQHKFGVNQRNELINRSPVPHLFNLSATPIPRTVALGLLGEINISNITHKPQNRLPTKTFIVSPTHFKKSPNWLKDQLSHGSQIFVVCPNIEEHQLGLASVDKITKIYEKIADDKFPVFTIHGKMNSDKQKDILTKFITAQKGILVSTSLIEVGIDIPSANIMIIHSAERFGLASLHQLRGRVGRGKEQGYCFLVPTNDDQEETERLQLLQKYKSGLILAKKDLSLRGAGEIFGTKQHGLLPTRLKYFWSKKLFLTAKKIAREMVENCPQKAKHIVSSFETC